MGESRESVVRPKHIHFDNFVECAECHAREAVVEAAQESSDWHMQQASKHITDVKLAEKLAALTTEQKPGKP